MSRMVSWRFELVMGDRLDFLGGASERMSAGMAPMDVLDFRDSDMDWWNKLDRVRGKEWCIGFVLMMKIGSVRCLVSVGDDGEPVDWEGGFDAADGAKLSATAAGALAGRFAGQVSIEPGVHKDSGAGV